MILLVVAIGFVSVGAALSARKLQDPEHADDWFIENFGEEFFADVAILDLRQRNSSPEAPPALST